jgi:hypothetical protein
VSDPLTRGCANVQRRLERKREREGLLVPLKIQGHSLGYFSENSAVRRFCWGMVHSAVFEGLILMCIIANCILLAFDSESNAE